MQQTGFTFLSVIVVGALVVGGFFAIKTLKAPASYVSNERETVGDLYPLETDPTTQTTATLPEASVPETPKEPVVETSPSASTDTLQVKLEALLAVNGILIKQGDRGPNIGTIQEFMNRYFKKSLKVDNDFGPTLLANVKEYQKQNKISQTGQVGPVTLRAMIEWTQKN